MASEPKPLRCAIYTRKSTEHGLELEFNSLDAQRDACEAYIKSQSEQPDQKLIQALVRAHHWAASLANGEFGSVEELAGSVNLHPKVVRSEIRMAFLAPEITDSVLTAGCSFGLADLRKISALSWQKQLEELRQRRPPPRSR
jgi:hypothetical protein